MIQQEMYLNGQWSLTAPTTEWLEEAVSSFLALRFQVLVVATIALSVPVLASVSVSLYICSTECCENQYSNIQKSYFKNLNLICKCQVKNVLFFQFQKCTKIPVLNIYLEGKIPSKILEKIFFSIILFQHNIFFITMIC